MNDQKNIQSINKTKSLQNIIIDEVYQRISDVATDAESTSKEKYIAKEKLIESADDMSTQEKLNAMDTNYDRRNQERWQNALFYFAIISFSVVGLSVARLTIGSPFAVKNVRKLPTTA